MKRTAVMPFRPMTDGEVQAAERLPMEVVGGKPPRIKCPDRVVKTVCYLDDEAEEGCSTPFKMKPCIDSRLATTGSKKRKHSQTKSAAVLPSPVYSSPVPVIASVPPSEYKGTPTPDREKFSTSTNVRVAGDSVELYFDGPARTQKLVFGLKRLRSSMGGSKSETVAAVLLPTHDRALKTRVVVKQPTKDPLVTSGPASFKNEKTVLDKIAAASSKSPILHLINSYTADERQFILPLAVPVDNLEDVIETLSNPDRTTILYDIVNQALLGLEELHTRIGYAHLDIKPDNMVIQHRDGILKLIDFGESLPLGTSGLDADRKGAPYYRSPRGGSTRHRDLYSLGVVLRDYMAQFKITDSFLSRFHCALTGQYDTVAGALAEFRPHFNDAQFAQARQIWREILKEFLPR